MSKTVLVVGFKYDSCVALKNDLINKYFTIPKVTKDPRDYTNTNASSDYYKYKVYIGSTYENWYGWSEDQKRDAYLSARSNAEELYSGAVTTINNYIYKFNHGSNIIVGIPLVELNDTNNNYKIIVSDPRNANNNVNCVSLQLTSVQINNFKSLVNSLKTAEKPQFYLMNADSSNTYTVNTVDV